MPGCDHHLKIEHRPAVADLAVGRESMLVTVEAAEGPEVDHALNMRRPRLTA